jgi:serine/threonine-protein kinase RsbW
MSAAETLTVPGTPAGVRQALDAIEAWAGRSAASDALRRRMLTALDEILSNVVRHGHGAGRPMVISAWHRADRVEVEVADGNSPFDPLSLPAPETGGSLEERRPGGLGIMLVRALSDDVRYERRAGRNHLIVTWRLAPGGEGHSNADR